MVPAHELAVGQHDAVVAGLGRPIQKRDAVVDVLVDQQIGGQIDPAVLQGRLGGRLGTSRRKPPQMPTNKTMSIRIVSSDRPLPSRFKF